MSAIKYTQSKKIEENYKQRNELVFFNACFISGEFLFDRGDFQSLGKVVNTPLLFLLMIKY